MRMVLRLPPSGSTLRARANSLAEFESASGNIGGLSASWITQVSFG
jgi:hypothetical protein